MALAACIASAAQAAAPIIDQIGPMDGSQLMPGTIAASQYFEAAYDAYDIGAVETMDQPDAHPATIVEAVISGFDGYLGLDGMQGVEVNFYSTIHAAGQSLSGDLASSLVLGPLIGDPDWAPVDSDLVAIHGLWPLPTGSMLVAVIPVNEYGTNGQSGIAGSLTGDSTSWSANPGLGFGFGPFTERPHDLSLRVWASTDPCEQPLPACAQDVAGSDGSPDGEVTVDDLLATISAFGTVGDGTARPLGDCHPLPAGDCAVTVDDLLSIISVFGMVCEPVGACCSQTGACTDGVTEAGCGGTWLGPDSMCADCMPSELGACCWSDGSCSDGMSGTDCWEAGGLWSGLYSLCSTTTCFAAPANDVCENATDIAAGETPFDITWAITNGDVIPDGVCDLNGHAGIANDIWFRFTGPADGILTVSTCSAANFDTRLVLYDACGAAATTLACNDDASGCSGYTSLLEYYAVEAGGTYLIRVGAFAEGYGEDRTGTLTINFEVSEPGACCVGADDCIPDLTPYECVQDYIGVFQGAGTSCDDADCAIPGDRCDTAVPFGPGENLFNTTGAVDSGTLLPDESLCPDTDLHWSFPLPDFWATYDVTSTGFIDISLCDEASFDTSMVIYRGASCSSLTQIACNGNAPPTGGCQANHSAILGLPVIEGDRLYIRIAGVDAATGSGTCTISETTTVLGACCVAGNCTDDLSAPDCLSSGGVWHGGGQCQDLTCPGPPEPCTSGLGDEPLSPNASWIAGTSDTGEGHQRAADLSVGSISTCTVSGLAAVFDGGGWSQCGNAAGMPVVWTLYADDEGLPGAALATGVVDTVAEQGAVYGNGFPLHAWTFAPGYAGPIDWISLQSQSGGQGACWFLWMSASPEGSGLSAQRVGSDWYFENFDLNLCVEE